MLRWLLFLSFRLHRFFLVFRLFLKSSFSYFFTLSCVFLHLRIIAQISVCVFFSYASHCLHFSSVFWLFFWRSWMIQQTDLSFNSTSLMSPQHTLSLNWFLVINSFTFSLYFWLFSIDFVVFRECVLKFWLGLRHLASFHIRHEFFTILNALVSRRFSLPTRN